MKRRNRIKILLLSALIASYPLSARSEARFTAMTAGEKAERISRIDDFEARDFGLGGLETELTGEYLGIGLDILGNFTQGKEKQWFFNWHGQLFLRYHLFGNDGLLDPFFEGAWGTAGTCGMSDNREEIQISLVPSIGAGVNLLLQKGFYLGGRLSYRPAANPVPLATLKTAEITPWQCTLFAGIRLGTPERRRHEYFDRYFRQY